MSRRRALLSILLWVGISAAAAAQAAADRANLCRAALERSLARIDTEAESIRSLFDAEAAMIDAPTYELEKTQRDLLGELEGERRRARARHRQCLDGAAPGGGT